MANTHMDLNLVQHAVLMLYGNKTKSIVEAKANALIRKQVEVQQFTFSAWLDNCTIKNNTLLANGSAQNITAAFAAAASLEAEAVGVSNANSATAASAEAVQQFFLSAGNLSAWVGQDRNNNINSSSGSPVVTQVQDDNYPEESSMQLVPLPKANLTRFAGIAAVSSSPPVCQDALKELWPEISKGQLNPQVASVVWGSEGVFVGLNLTVTGSRGFPIAIRVNGGWLMHLEGARLTEQNVSSRLLEMWGGDVVVRRLVLDSNAAAKDEMLKVQGARLAFLKVRLWQWLGNRAHSFRL